MKLAVLFPGIGYTCQKPLMYYAGRLAEEMGYETLSVAYAELPKKVRGDAKKLRKALESAFAQAERQLDGTDWGRCADILFIGKSIGTAVAAQYAAAHGLDARLILLTPLAETFQWKFGSAVAFHGTADPWADTAGICRACEARSIPLNLTEGANHSLETGNVKTDVKTLADTMEIIREFIMQ